MVEELLSRVATESSAVAALLDRVAGEEGWQSVNQPLEVVQDDVPIDKAAELQKQWQTALGQLWAIGDHRLWCGDSREPPPELFNGNCIRLIWTDPPYGVDYVRQRNEINAAANTTGAFVNHNIANDSQPPSQVFELFRSALKTAVIYSMTGAACYASVASGPMLVGFIEAFESAGFSFHHHLVWIKQHMVFGRSDYHYKHEPILYGWLENGPHYFTEDRSQVSIFEVDRTNTNELHPTQKPVELIAKMVANSSRAGEIVYDPFCGSGTTLIAAHQLNRIAYGIEIDPGYCAVTLERLSNLGLKPQLIN